MLVVFSSPVYAEAPIVKIEPYCPIEAGQCIPTESLETAIRQKIITLEDTYHLDKGVMAKVVECESGFNPKIVGDHGESLGLVQIHSSDWPEITEAQAFNVDFSLNFLAEKLSEGKGNLWTCYRKLQG